jgi:Flp pilus assembly protein TadG
MYSLITRFLKNHNGNMMVVFGLASVPIMGFIGGAVDFNVVVQKRLNLQMALDAAALSAARGAPLSQGDLTAKISTLMTPKLTESGIPTTKWRIIAAQDDNLRVTASAEADVSTPFLSMLQMANMTVGASTEVYRTKNNLEIALVMDNTGSMATNNRIGALRTAATTLIDTMFAEPDAASKVKVSLVPFVTSVNIKVPNIYNSAWMDNNAQAQYHGQNFNKNPDGSNSNHFTLFNDLGVAWKGCVEARAEPYDVQDTVPNSAIADTLFVPWFWPDEPDSGISYNGGTSYNNHYMPDDYTLPVGTDNKTTALARQKNTSKYATKKASASIDETPSVTSGPNKSCPEPLTPLTNDATLMRQKISAMMPWNNSGTNIAQGMVWGWSTLSPEAPFTEGVAYEDDKTIKAMIVLTDGENEVFGGWNTHNKSDYSSYGYLGVSRLGTTDKAAGVTAVNTKVTTLCNNIKAKNIRLYTITFELSSTQGQTLFRNCATKTSMYYNSPSTSQLQGIFQAIAADLSTQRFSK